MSLKPLLNDLQKTIQDAQNQEITTTKPNTGPLTDYKQRKHEAIKKTIITLIEKLKSMTTGKANKIATTMQKTQELDKLMTLLEEIADYATDDNTPTEPTTTIRAPYEIQQELQLDIQEIQNCMKSGCHRSAIIMCGRIMETALHRKYYDTTGQDLLEKAPGIGLGNLIARLNEKGIPLDPGISNQIHLINQLRIYSVHKKQEPFIPSREQAQAIYLYTVDVVQRLFR